LPTVQIPGHCARGDENRTKGKEVKFRTHISLGLIVGTGEGSGDLDVTTGEAKLVPTLEHARAIRHPIGSNIINPDVKATIGGIDLTGIVPLLVASVPIPKIDCFPKRVVAGVE